MVGENVSASASSPAVSSSSVGARREVATSVAVELGREDGDNVASVAKGAEDDDEEEQEHLRRRRMMGLARRPQTAAAALGTRKSILLLLLVLMVETGNARPRTYGKT